MTLQSLREAEQQATVDLTDLRRETKAKGEAAIHGEALMKRELNAMQNTVDRGKDQIRRLLGIP